MLAPRLWPPITMRCAPWARSWFAWPSIVTNTSSGVTPIFSQPPADHGMEGVMAFMPAAAAFAAMSPDPAVVTGDCLPCM